MLGIVRRADFDATQVMNERRHRGAVANKEQGGTVMTSGDPTRDRADVGNRNNRGLLAEALSKWLDNLLRSTRVAHEDGIEMPRPGCLAEHLRESRADLLEADEVFLTGSGAGAPRLRFPFGGASATAGLGDASLANMVAAPVKMSTPA